MDERFTFPTVPALDTTATQAPGCVVQSLALGALLLVVFLAGSVLVARVPLLRDPVQELLDHARYGSLGVVALITVVNGVAEELYFRGALYAGVGRRHAVAVTTVVYALVTATSAIPLLVFAAAVVGVVVGLQRRVTGGILGPIVLGLVGGIILVVTFVRYLTRQPRPPASQPPIGTIEY